MSEPIREAAESSSAASRVSAASSVPTASPGIPVIAVGQFAPVGDRGANLRVIRSLVDRAADRGATLVVLPEYSSWFSPTLDAGWLEHAEPLDGPFVEGLAAAASARGVTIVAGLAERLDRGDRFGNTVVAVSSDARILARYRKLHLYDAFGARESDWIEPGVVEAPAVFDHAGTTIGLQTCYDLRFPEVTRRLVDAGAEIVAVPSEWVRGPSKESHWRTLVTARAIENTVWVAAADHAPPIGVGNSMVVDPMGVEVATIGEQTDVALAWIDPAHVAETRRVNPALALRRFRVVER